MHETAPKRSRMRKNDGKSLHLEATEAPGAQQAASELSEALRLASALELKRRGCVPLAPVENDELYAAEVLQKLARSGVPWLCVKLPELQQPVVFAEPLGLGPRVIKNDGRLQYGQDLELPVGVLAPPRQEEQDFRALQGVNWLSEPQRGCVYDANPCGPCENGG